MGTNSSARLANRRDSATANPDSGQSTAAIAMAAQITDASFHRALPIQLTRLSHDGLLFTPFPFRLLSTSLWQRRRTLQPEARPTLTQHTQESLSLPFRAPLRYFFPFDRSPERSERRSERISSALPKTACGSRSHITTGSTPPWPPTPRRRCCEPTPLLGLQ